MKQIKIILGTVAVFGTLMSGFELYFAPDALILESSIQYPGYVSWIRWIITLIAVVGYLFIELKDQNKHFN